MSSSDSTGRQDAQASALAPFRGATAEHFLYREVLARGVLLTGREVRMISELDVPEATRALLERYGFDAATFAALQTRCRQAGEQGGANQNRLSVPMAQPLDTDFAELPAVSARTPEGAVLPGSAPREQLASAGVACIARGELAVVVLAGGMATRFGGAVKACVEVLPGLSFLELKLMDIRHIAEQCAATIPVFLMTSFATDAVLREAAARSGTPRVPVETFAQLISLRLTSQGELFRDAAGQPSPYAPGHGDLVPALQRAGILTQLAERGIKYLMMTNVDNLAATIDPSLLALHVQSRREMTFEVVRRDAADQGGTPARVSGVLQVIEALREPAGFDRSSIPWFSTNSLYFDVRALQREFPLDWFSVEKRVEGRTAIQYERFVNQLTAFLSCRALLVERDGPDARFLPIKEPADLERARPRILELLRGRGLTLPDVSR